MTRTQQQKFVRELSRNITARIIANLKAVPSEWDGHELRCWLAEEFADAATMSAIRKEPRSRRARDYRSRMLILPRL